jgi:hypothetical protein
MMTAPELTASPTPAGPSRPPAFATPSNTTPSTSTAPSSCAKTGGRPPKDLSLVGRRGRAFAFASLKNPGKVTVEGRVSDSAAWSTSKVLVVAAYLDTVVDGDPSRVSAKDRRRITAALTRSDANAVTAIRDRIPRGPGRAMTSVLRTIGDETTVAPDSYQGTMSWSIREQVRFMAALNAGRVVSPAASRFLLRTMRPIEAHSWGLGTINATAYKGGWLRSTTATRQMGLVDGYAVAITTTIGPAEVQTDGDSAHVQQMNRLARLLRDRLAFETACR